LFVLLYGPYVTHCRVWVAS